MCYWQRYSEEGSPVAGGGKDSVNTQAAEIDPECDVQSPERTAQAPGNPDKQGKPDFLCQH